MPLYFNYHSSVLVLAIFTFAVFFPSPVHATQTNASNYDLSLSFDLAAHTLTGTAKITIEPGEKLNLSLPDMEITGTLLQKQNGEEYILHPEDTGFTLPAEETTRTLFLSYTKTITKSYDNKIAHDGIALTSNWYPLPHTPKLYRVTATLPENFSAITEADTFPLEPKGDTVTSTFSRPTVQIHFIAGPYTIQKQKVRPGLFVYSMFFKEDQELADDYLQAATAYLNRYEQEIGSYPFHHYVIVANRFPTGFGMPTFTLLGQVVLRLPFIKNTSLGHEIVHSWFGNGVDVDYSEGNWCEGLTTFLADSAFREEQGEGVAGRQDSITRYLSYVHPQSAISLAQFISASHIQPMAKSQRAVGYDRGSLFFHELQKKIGKDSFTKGLRLFFTAHNGGNASWSDLQKNFESASQSDLGSFFSERLLRTDIPSLAIENETASLIDNSPNLSFTLLQKTETPFSLDVQVKIATTTGIITRLIKTTQSSLQVNIPLKSWPLSFTIDPEYNFLRTLTKREFPPVWSRFLGAEKKLVILGSEEERDIYAPLLATFDEAKITVILSDDVTNEALTENTLLFLGENQKACRSLFGSPALLSSGVRLDVRRNPLNTKHVAALFTSIDKKETARVARRLSHYGKYSFLEFSEGKNISKKRNPAETGIKIILEELPKGGATENLKSFSQIVDKMAQSTVVYVGEQHTSVADHLLQLRIIEALYQKHQKLAIGMEMFPTSSQPALDSYTLGDKEMDEATFLKESDYFNVWRYDYRYFQKIFNFARNNHIPVIALNLDRKIVSTVFRTGTTDTLTEEVRNTLPLDRNLDMPGYTERLSQMHNIHVQGNHGSGAESGFIQAQGLWDETMAANVVSYLKNNPDYKMVVLAGSQHTRKDSGIPPRVKQRLDIKQASVLNIYNNFSPVALNNIADYFFLATPQELPEIPKIGIVLTSNSEEEKESLTISEISPHSKAGEAGLQVGDILKTINKTPIATMADLRIAMLNSRVSEIISITILRDKNGVEKEMQFHVELTLGAENK